MNVDAFQKKILAWHRAHGRPNLPWRTTHDPYRILVSEVMLQQTQVSRVIPKYAEFLRSFPTIRALALAPLASVLRAWQGLGYNRRAANLKRAADAIIRDHNGRVPSDPVSLEALPGIGPGTAGAIRAFAFNAPNAFIETNIRRVYLHFFFSGRKNVRDREILAKIKSTLPRSNARRWYWALMDFGAEALKSVPNPNRRSRHYARQGAFEGSERQLRGWIIRTLAEHGALSESRLGERRARHGPPNHMQPGRLRNAIRKLATEGLLQIKSDTVSLPHI